MKLSGPTSVSNVKTLDDIIRFASQMIGVLVNAINGGISFYDNIDCNVKSVVFTTADQDVAVTHNLGRVATNYVLAGSSVATQIYNGVNSPDRNVIYLRASVAATTTIVVF